MLAATRSSRVEAVSILFNKQVYLFQAPQVLSVPAVQRSPSHSSPPQSPLNLRFAPFCWGDGEAGKLGTGDRSVSRLPSQVNVGEVVSVACGAHNSGFVTGTLSH